jgi:hypothetical protein
MIYNLEVVFSMAEIEGAGVFSFGIGKKAQLPCGKSEISNMITIPSKTNIKSFDVQD